MEAAFGSYAAASGLLLEIEIYRTDTVQAAVALYAEGTPPSAIFLDLPYGKGITDEGALGSYSAFLQMGRHFAQLWVTEKGAVGRTILSDFATHLSRASERAE